MYFNSIEFLLFFTVVFLLTRLRRCTGPILLAASVTFYVAAGWFDLTLIACVIVTNWVLCRTIQNPRPRVWIAVLVNLGVLAFFKYRQFFLGEIDTSSVSFQQLALPLGISFYTFQVLAYQVDVLRRVAPEEQSLPRFALFISFFPQLIAGPIVRARQLIPQLSRLWSGSDRRVRLYGYGLLLCLLGLTKKIVLADSTAPWVDYLFSAVPGDAASAWLGAWLFGFQIYFDFSGYSDIAVGSAFLLGIRLPINFRTPYLSTSPREFWARWHITLSTWIRDYLYIPLGGNHGGRFRQLIVLVVVMGLAGLWHGASWGFMVWGIAWGSYIAIWRLTHRWLDLIPGRWVFHIAVVMMLWVFFRAPDVSFAYKYLMVMFGQGAHGWLGEEGFAGWGGWIVAGCVGLMALHWGEQKLLTMSVWRIRRIDGGVLRGCVVGLCLWLVLMPTFDENPFIYFRF